MKTFKSIICCALFSLLAGSVTAQKQADTDIRKQLVSKALDKSYEIKNAKNQLASDQCDKLKAYATYIPNFSLNSMYTYLNNDIKFVVPPISVSTGIPGLTIPPVKIDPIILQKQSAFRFDATASMVLFTGLKVPWIIKAINHKKKADAALISMDETEVIYSVISYYDMLALVDQSQNVLTESDKRLDQEYAFVKKALKEGLINSYDESKIEIAKSQLLAKQLELNMKRKVLESALADLTGADSVLIKSLHPDLKVWGYINSTISAEKRPEITALSEAVIANKYKRRATWSNYMPTVYTFAKKEFYKNDLSALDPQWYVGAGVSWKLFDGLQNACDIKKSGIEIQTAQNNYNNAVSKLNVNLEKARLNLGLTNQLIVVAQQRVKSADKGLELSVRQFEQGLISISERLESETDVQKARLEYIQAIYDQRMASMELLKATGNLTTENIQN